MKIKIYDHNFHGNITIYDQVEEIKAAGTMLLISLDIDYSIERNINYLQVIEKDSYSRIEIM